MGTVYHEPAQELSPATRDMHRALSSLIEELEAVDWYHQRAEVASDDELKAILLHNRDEEIEHAAMALEWLRRQLPKFDEELRTYLFQEGSIAGHEEAHTGGGSSSSSSGGSGLGLGQFKKG